MKRIAMAATLTTLAPLVVGTFGCGGDQQSLSPAKQAEIRSTFHKKPDINTLKPEMRKWVEAQIKAAHSGKPLSSPGSPPTGSKP